MRVLLGVLMGAQGLVAACGGDDSACLTATTWCESGVVMRCESGTPAMVADCAALGEALGVEKQCGRHKMDEDNVCVDLRQVSCPMAGESECGPSRKGVRTCVATDFGMIWDTQSLEPTCTSGQQCHPTMPGQFVCVTPPIKTCTNRAQCDGLTLETCAGNMVDGFVVVSTMACPTSCEVRLDGSSTCN